MWTLTWAFDKRRSSAAYWTALATLTLSQNAWIEMRGIGRARSLARNYA
jgi:hypothetical protein